MTAVAQAVPDTRTGPDRATGRTTAAPGGATTTTLRPRFEGTNICTWIGFKHVNYLVEEAVLDHLRQQGSSSRTLFEDHGLGVDLVSIDTRILHALHIDDEVRATVTPAASRDGAMRVRVVITADRPGGEVKAVTATVGVLLRRDDRHGGASLPVPDQLAAHVVDTIGSDAERVPLRGLELSSGRGATTQDVPAQLRTGDGPAVAWRWRIPYFYCHHTVRLQMSGLLRQMEEVVDLFLAERNVSIRTLLDEQDWIPVVPHSSVTMLGEALMEEDLVTVLEVDSVFKAVTYDARMDCWAVRGDELVKVATGRITHGYAHIDGRGDWSLVDFDERMLTAVGAR